jgi:hypothetical protein
MSDIDDIHKLRLNALKRAAAIREEHDKRRKLANRIIDTGYAALTAQLHLKLPVDARHLAKLKEIRKKLWQIYGWK